MKHQRTFVISLIVLLSIVVFTVYVQVSAQEPSGTDVQQSEAAAIPLEANEGHAGSEYFAANPELMAAGRYEIAVEDEGLTGSKHYAANPELMVVSRFTASVIENGKTPGSEFFAANPELMTAGRYVTHNEASPSEIFAANPELMAAHRYTATTTEK